MWVCSTRASSPRSRPVAVTDSRAANGEEVQRSIQRRFGLGLKTEVAGVDGRGEPPVEAPGRPQAAVHLVPSGAQRQLVSAQLASVEEAGQLDVAKHVGAQCAELVRPILAQVPGIVGPGRSRRRQGEPDWQLVRPPERYLSGQENALMSWLNGGRGLPEFDMRPYERGVRGRATLVNNVETFAHIALIVRHGAEWFAAVGPDRSPGYKIVSISGHVVRPGNYEVPMGITIRRLIDDVAGGDEGSRMGDNPTVQFDGALGQHAFGVAPAGNTRSRQPLGDPIAPIFSNGGHGARALVVAGGGGGGQGEGARLQRRDVLEQRNGPLIVGFGVVIEVELAEQVFAVGLWSDGAVVHWPDRHKLACQRGCNRARNFILHFQNIRKVPVIGLRPHVIAACCIDQLSRDAHAVAGFPNTTLKHRANVQLVGDLLAGGHARRLTPAGCSTAKR